MKQLCVGFVGLGLIGGSIAKAIRKFHSDAVILAYDVDHSALLLAQKEGTLSKICSSIDGSFTACDYVFLCAPILYNHENVKRLLPYLSPTCILSDVGSVKGDIHQVLRAIGFLGLFIGGHPMTGSEKSDYANSSERLLENAYYILTPEERIPVESVLKFKAFISSLGALPLVLSVNTHDTVAAVISHLPHIIAASLVHFLINQEDPAHYMQILAAGGFKDMTRVASSNVRMWEDICLTNSEKISMMLSEYIETLKEIQKQLETKDRSQIGRFFQEAKDYRDSMSDHAHGSIQKIYALYCDIADETGGIAKIAVLLADHEISIKNIGIIHNREFEEGVLRIEFYNAASSLKALHTLKQNGYFVIERN